jgi:hypothetical protein
MSTVWMGNTLAKETYLVPEDADDPNNDRMIRRARFLRGKRICLVTPPADNPLLVKFIDITSPNGVWANHAGEPPAWIVSDDAVLEAMLASQYKCPVGLPDDDEWRATAAHPGLGLLDFLARKGA